MRKYLTATCVTLVLLGCERYEPKFPTSTPADAAAEYERAVGVWFSAVGREPAPVRLESSPSGLLCGGAIVDACFNHRSRTLSYDETLPPPRLRVAMLHEVGHALGVRGHLPPGNVMAASGKLPISPTAADAAAVQSK